MSKEITNRKRKRFRALALSFLICVILGILTIVICNAIVKRSAKQLLYDDVQEIPYRKVGLVLGTSPLAKSGRENLYYRYRLQAVADLYFAGKISYILISGDNHIKGYNEPEWMRDALVAMGIPSSVIYLDYAGFRTYDSMIRAKKVFDLSSVTVISQYWHNERAVYIASRTGLDAIAYNAKDLYSRRNYLKNHSRELLAKVKVVLDFAFHKKPKFLGEVITIPESHNAEYRALLGSVAERVERGDTVSIHEILEVMPETEDFYHIALELDSGCTTPRLYLLWEEYAVADSSGFMENYLRMFQWSDGCYAEGMYDVLSVAETRHKAKFDSLMGLSSMQASAQRYYRTKEEIE